MNKKFLSAILFGALMVTSTGTFVSCKDYDDDIDAINSELTDIKSQIAALQAKVDAGKWITGVSSSANGVTITLSDGQTLNINNGKDGAQGEAGKDGSVVEVKEGVLYINGEATEIKVAEEAPAALPCVKVEEGELFVLNAEGEYVATGIKAGGVTASKENGYWTITVGEDVIVVPGSAALTSIAIEGEMDLTYYYGKVNKDKEWGWNKEETMPAGFYTKLGSDVVVLLNPAEADATAFEYTFKNSLNESADVKFFEEAKPANVVLTMARAASESGLWVLPAAVTSSEAANIESLRRELYLNFKQNDGKDYAMSLVATDGMGNTAVRSAYDYTLTLAAGTAAPAVEPVVYNKVGETYYPVFVGGPIYDYKIRVKQTSENLKWAKLFGITITEDGKGYYAQNDIAIYHNIVFEVAAVTINGFAKTVTFQANFSEETVEAAGEIRTGEFVAPFDATWSKTNKVFEMKMPQLDITELITSTLSDDQLMMFNENYKKAKAELIGGETTSGSENYNADNRNKVLANKVNAAIGYNATKGTYTLDATFIVSSDCGDEPEDFDSELSWIAYNNFQLYTAYQLNLTITDPDNASIEVATVALPFEFEAPTLDIVQQDGDFTEFGTIIIDFDANNNAITRRALYAYGAANGGKMYVPLYDSFDAWKAKGSEAGVTANFKYYVENAVYYYLSFTSVDGTRILDADGQSAGTSYVKKLNSDLDYSAVYKNLNTWATDAAIEDEAEQSLVDKKNNVIYKHKELYVPMFADYKFYGVYDAFDERNKTTKMHDQDFYLVFASWLNHSTLEMQNDSYATERGSHTLFITNDDLNFVTPKDDAFYLFDDISAAGKVLTRQMVNIEAFNEEQRPFTTVTKLFDEDNFVAYPTDGNNTAADEITVEIVDTPTTYCDADLKTGELTLKHDAFTAHETKIRIYNIPSVAETADASYATGIQQAFQGGMLIQLPKNIEDQQSVTITVTLSDEWGYTKSFDIEVKKLK